MPTAGGVFESEFQLTDRPILGAWHFSAHVGSETRSKYFDVAEYVPQKFEVFIDTAAKHSLKDGQFHVSVNAKYFYGKTMHGTASVSISNYRNAVVMSQTTKLPVNATFGMGDGIKEPGIYTVAAEVTEDTTGLTQTAEKRIEIVDNLYMGSIECNESVFTPGTPLKLKVRSFSLIVCCRSI